MQRSSIGFRNRVQLNALCLMRSLKWWWKSSPSPGFEPGTLCIPIQCLNRWAIWPCLGKWQFLSYLYHWDVWICCGMNWFVLSEGFSSNSSCRPKKIAVSPCKPSQITDVSPDRFHFMSALGGFAVDLPWDFWFPSIASLSRVTQIIPREINCKTTSGTHKVELDLETHQ